MHVAIVRPDQASEAVDVCIVVDVVRATTTAAVLCTRVQEVCVLGALADVDHLPAGAYVLFSELANLPAHLPAFDNSPVLARDADLAGRTPILVTTNGTLAVARAARFAREVVLGSFVNASAVIEYAQRASTIAIMPAGSVNKREPHAEDDGCAELLAARLRGRDVDARAVVEACEADARIVRRRATEATLGADLDICFAIDSVPVVPRVAGAGDQRWFRLIH